MKIKAAYAKLMSTVHANTVHGISQAIAPVVFHALVHGQVRIGDMNRLRELQDSNLKKIKVALNKTMPISWNKEQGTYKVSKQKRKTLQAKFDTSSIPALAEEIRILLSPQTAQGADAPQKEVKAWGEAQVQNQLKRLDDMNADELEKQIKALMEVTASAQNKLRSRLAGGLQLVANG